MSSVDLYFNTTVAAACVFAAIVIICSISKKSSHSKGKTPPEPPGSWPIIGHLHLLSGPQLPHLALGAVADKLGPVFRLRLGQREALVVSNWEVAKELYTTNDLAISSRPQLTAGKHLGYNFAMFGIAPYGEYWRQIRKVATLELLSNRRLELLKHVKVSEVETSIKELYELWEREKEYQSGSVLVELRKWFGRISMNVILRMIAGNKRKKSGNSASNGEGDKEEGEQCWDAIRKFLEKFGVVIRDAVPLLPEWVDVGGREKAMKETAKVLDGVAGEWLEEHKRKREVVGENYEEGKEEDFMDVLLSVLDGRELAGYDPDTVCKATSLAMIVGGTDTTMVTMTWAISLLLNNRHVLIKAQKELDNIVGKNKLKIDDTDISKLIYLQAIVKETLRLYPSAPMSVPRQFMKDCNVGGYHVNKGTWLMVNLWKIQTDPNVWPNSLEFKPERFLTTNKDVDVRGQHFELIPFGGGRRICPGISFALQTVHFTLANLMHAFEISTVEDVVVDMTESAGITNLKATPLQVHISPRLSHHLYA